GLIGLALGDVAVAAVDGLALHGGRAERALLDHVGQLVREQRVAGGRVGLVLAGRERDVLADPERVGAAIGGHARGGGGVVHARGRELPAVGVADRGGGPGLDGLAVAELVRDRGGAVGVEGAATGVLEVLGLRGSGRRTTRGGAVGARGGRRRVGDRDAGGG